MVCGYSSLIVKVRDSKLLQTQPLRLPARSLSVWWGGKGLEGGLAVRLGAAADLHIQVLQVAHREVLDV